MKTISKKSGKIKPSDLLEEQLRKKEAEYMIIKEIFEKKEETGEIKIPKKMDELIKNFKPKPKSINKTDTEKMKKEKLKFEEKETLKLLDKLESQVIKKNKLSSLNNTKRLIDTLTKTDKFDRKLLDDSEFRKTIKREKLAIEAEPVIIDPKITHIDEEEKLENDYINNLSKEKIRFFNFKVRELYDFLISIKLLRYIEIFIEDGFEDMESILEINEDYFKEREFPEEYQKRILKKVASLRMENLCVPGIETSTDANFDNLPPIGKDKHCCWNCLKIIKEKAIEEYFNENIIKLKFFCSEICQTSYKAKIYMICYNDKCNKQFEKGIGVVQDDNWYCSEECVDTCEYRNTFKRNLEEQNQEKEQYDLDEDEDSEYDPMNDF